ncbi:MAG: hypothetical protein EAX81_03190 [Candidatus Thorarchaeota archaeon]|nr:hypothetical protein [Candidatus Thorarchaeota archaeon]
MQQRRIAIGVAVLLVTGFAVLGISYFYLGSERDSILNFYVFGDSQGYQDGIHQIAAISAIYNPDFVFHCGDLTPFGQESQYNAVIDALAEFTIPVYTTPGNHDVRLDGGTRYLEHFGPALYSFDLGSAHFAVFNSTTGDIPEADISWLSSDLEASDAEFKFVFSHIPPFDPRPEQDHTFSNLTTASRLMTIFQETNVTTVFSGHVHIFNESVVQGVRYVITGGAGASLYASPENGGYYHFVNVTLTESELLIEPVLLDAPSLQRNMVEIRNQDESLTLTLDDLLVLSDLEGFSSFQNQFDNWRGQGTYRGVLIADLLKFVGGMQETDILRVTANDGYQYEFCYSNVYPNSSWHDIQGDMILAYSFNETLVPDWTDGMRLVMLVPDGGYSNEDLRLTSAPGMGYYIYESAGASWVRYVSNIEVIQQ